MPEELICRDVYVLDDDAAVRATIARVLATKGYAAVCFADGASLLNTARDCVPLCILLDICLPEPSGIEILQALRAQGCTAPVIMISGKGDIATAVEAIKAGADEYIEKPFYGKRLVEVLQATIERRWRACVPSASIHLPGLEALTPREIEIVDQCVGGATSKEAAQKLGISPRTVEDHRSTIMKKLQVKNVAELVRKITMAGGAPPRN